MLYFPKQRLISLVCKTDATGKPEKIYKHLVQQQVQQVAHNFRVVSSYGHIWIQENSESSPLKINIYFSLLYHNLKFVLQYMVHFGEQL